MSMVDYGIVIVYIVSMVLVGLYFQRKVAGSIDSYFLGNRKIPWWALGASGMSSNLDISGTMINTAFIFALGASGFFIEIRGGVTLIMAFLMIFQGKWNRRALVMTLAEWMHFRFGTDKQGDAARLIAALSIIIMTVAMITYFAVGSGKFVGEFLGIPDIGQVSDVLDEQEQIKVEQLIHSVVSHKDSLQLAGVSSISTLKIYDAVLNNTAGGLQKSWGRVKEDLGNVTKITAFDIELSKISKISQVYEKKLAAGENLENIKTASLAFHNEINSLQSAFKSATKFSLIIKSQFLAALLMIVLAMIYTVASGLYGVVWTDVFQGVLIFGAIIYVCAVAFFTFDLPEVFNVSVPLSGIEGGFMSIQTTKEAWTSMIPNWTLDMPAESAYSIYNLFGIAILFYLIKVTIEGSGGTSQYMIQRFFASRSDRESGLLSLFWTFLLSFRWPFIAAIAMMGVVLGMQQGIVQDPETVLPAVINNLVPMGIKGLLVAGLMAAAMSTFDSTVNAGAAYWVKDIYQTYINPKASKKSLMIHSRVSSVIIVILGLGFMLLIKNINEIWGWITSSLGAGLLIPTLARWYWWRMNGYGFAAGTVAGMAAAVLQRIFLPDIPEYFAFMIATSASLLGMIIGTYAAKPTDEKVLFEFYKRTRPFGFWGPIRKKIPADTMEQINVENKRDIKSTFMAVPWQVVLFLSGMAVILKRWDELLWLGLLLIVLSIGLYFSWYRHLSKEVSVE